MSYIFQENIQIVGRTVSAGKLSRDSSDEFTRDFGDTSTITINIDCCTMINMGFQNIITKQPTTSGTPINDNLARQALTWAVEGYLSTSTWGSTIQFIENFKNSNDYLGQRINNLQKALMNPYIFKVYGGYVVLDSMAMATCQTSQSPEKINALKINLVMQETIRSPGDAAQTAYNSNRDYLNRGKQNG
jgi:hypothetical protein